MAADPYGHDAAAMAIRQRWRMFGLRTFAHGIDHGIKSLIDLARTDHQADRDAEQT
jgi:hypothetical protein